MTNLKCQIVNVLGEIVFANDTENVSGKFSLQVNLSLLPTGVYFLKATGDEKVFNQKIIIE